MAPPTPRDLLAVVEAALLSPAPPSPAQRVELLHALRDAAPAFRALLSYPGPKASDRTQVEAKEVRLPDMPPIMLDDTDVQTARPASELRKGLMAGSPYSAINLGGCVLQQTQVAVPGGTAWLFTRFTHKDPHADGVPPPTSKWGSARPASELRKGLMAGSPYSAMNLGRALQRTQVAVPGGGARLFTRFIHRDAHADGAPPPTSIWGSRKLNDAEKANLYRQLRTIHNKREELYELSASVQKNYSIPSSIGRANKELLRSLSAQVDPRPTDHLWLMFRASRRLNNMLKFSAAVASVYVITTVQFPSGEE